MADWSNLPKDLVLLLAGLVLNDNDLDYYMNFRAVCHNWRQYTPDPKKNFTDPQFQPKSWVVLKDYGYNSCNITMVNLHTSRVLCKNIPQLCDYNDLFLDVDGGLIVIGKQVPDGGCCAWVLNPFTSSSVRFTVSIRSVEDIRAVAVTTSPVRLFVSNLWDFMGWADSDTQKYEERRAQHPHYPTRMMQFTGDVYVANEYGSIIHSTAEDAGITRGQSEMVKMTQIIGTQASWEDGDSYYYLVELAGELLRVSKRAGAGHPIHVQKVDNVRKVLVPVTSIGRRAIFISDVASFAIDTFPTIEAGCIYFMDPATLVTNTNRLIASSFHLEDQREENIMESGRRGLRSGPPTLLEVLAGYCEFTIPAYEYPFFSYEEDHDDLDGDEEASA